VCVCVCACVWVSGNTDDRSSTKFLSHVCAICSEVSFCKTAAYDTAWKVHSKDTATRFEMNGKPASVRECAA